MPLSGASKKEKILIIVGDAAAADHLSQALTAEGYSVAVASSAVEGTKGIFDILPHLILLDVVLPDGDGYDVLAKKQAEPLLAKIPVFLMSTQGVPINMRKVPQGSVAQFIMTYQSDPSDMVSRANTQFGYTTAAEASANAAAAGSATPKKRLLWVEDDKLIGNILEKKFISSGFDLTHCRNGEDAIKAMDEATSSGNVPDAVILDLLLPGMNGFDILQKMRMNDKLKKVPAMILSNLSKPSDLEKAKMLGAEKYLVKAAASLDQIVKEVWEMCK